MLEFLLILYILFVFVFPLPLLGLTSGLAVIYVLYRKCLLLKHQPVEGKRVLLLSGLSRTANLVCCLLLSLAMTFGVHFFIIENRYLFLFNLIFSLSVSIRWFDFTHRIYRRSIDKWLGDRLSGTFVVCIGLRKKTGVGMAPVFMDAGYLRDSGDCFEGTFFKHDLEASAISKVEKKSSEKIRILFSSSPPPFYPDALSIILREQRYPFMSRQTRDKIFQSLEKRLYTQPTGSTVSSIAK